MGARAEDTKATAVRLTDDVRARIEAVRGDRPMAAFVRDAILYYLEREEKG